jgi:hypothetical protein
MSRKEDDTMECTMLKEGLEGAQNRAVLSALFRELLDVETRPYATAAERVTVAVLLAVHVLGGPGVDVDSYLTRTCPIEQDTGRPPLLSVDDTTLLKSAYDDLAGATARAAKAPCRQGGGGGGPVAGGTPPDFFGVVLRRIVRGRDVYAHWREAHPTEKLRTDTFANVWEWMVRERKKVGASNTFEAIEELVARCMKKRVDKEGAKGLAAVLEPAEGSATAQDKVAAAAYASAASVTAVAPATDGTDGTGALELQTRKRKNPHEASNQDVPQEAAASTTGSKSPRLIEKQAATGSASTAPPFLGPWCAAPGPDLQREAIPDRILPTMQDDGESEAPIRPGILERRLSGERMVRILATKRVDDLTEKCNSLELRNAQLEEESARLRSELERATARARNVPRDQVLDSNLPAAGAVSDPAPNRPRQAETCDDDDSAAAHACGNGAGAQHQARWVPRRPSVRPIKVTGGMCESPTPPSSPTPPGDGASAAAAAGEAQTCPSPRCAFQPHDSWTVVRDLRAELVASRTAHGELHRAYAVSQNELDGVRFDDEALWRDAERAGNQLAQAREELSRATTANRALRRKVQVLEDTARQEQEDLRAELLASSTARDEIQRTLAETARELDDVRSHNEALRREAASAGDKTSHATEELNRAASANRALQGTVQELEERRQELEATVQGRTEELVALTEKGQRNEGEVQSLRGDLAAKTVDEENCKGEIQRLRVELAAKTVDEEKCKDEVQRMRGRLAVENVELVSCRGEVQSLRAELVAKAAELANCQASLNEVSRLREESQPPARLDGAGAQMEQEDRTAEDLRVRHLEQQIESMEQEIRSMGQDSELRLEQVNDDRDAARSKLGQVEADLEEAHLQVRRVSTDLEEATAELRRVSAELYQSREEREQHAAANRELQERVHHLEGELARLSKELDMYQLLSLRRFTG